LYRRSAICHRKPRRSSVGLPPSRNRMDPSIAQPTANSFFEGATIGAMYARGFVIVLVIVALVYASCHAWRMVQTLRLLDRGANASRAKEAVAPYDPPQGNKEVWR
jgi:hypothetical protein